jgi:hypothetical protein
MNRTAALAVVLLMMFSSLGRGEWEPKKAPLMTRWAKDVSPEKVHPEYPRPQMVREDWQNLNGLWEYAITAKDAGKPSGFEGEILVPFPIESALSGVMKRVAPDQRLWYRRSIELSERTRPEDGQRVLLHFGAVDWDTTVWVNGKEVGRHVGGYDPFTFDVTEALKSRGPQEIVLSVLDPTTAGTQPVGKQNLEPRGIWYTPTTGIWQTVWLERVPRAYIHSLRIVPDVDESRVRITVDAGDAAGTDVRIEVTGLRMEHESIVPRRGASGSAGEPIDVTLKDVRLWTPDEPWIYHFLVDLRRDGQRVDRVESYFAMRKISLGKDDQGFTRILLNDKPVFQYGLLDQGFWPDGLYTAPTDEALRYDIEVTKKLGFNMARKHVKVEPARWYYWCDKLGLIVWQDMPSGDKHIGRGQPDIERTKESAEQFEREWKAIIGALRNHPSIVMWVPFNEGWGQYDTARIAKLTKEYDPTRLVNSASGWVDRGVGDVHDIHVYRGPGMPPVEEERAAVLGEFGGLGLPVEGHTWQDKANWGYGGTFKSKEDLTEGYLGLLRELRLLIPQGLAAAVYTQTTDVEIEVNGLLTYDRAVLKFPADRLAAEHAKLHRPPPSVTTVVPTSEQAGEFWHYTTEKPRDGWEQPQFDHSQWKSGYGGFGQHGTPGAVVRLEWTSPDIWLRRTFTLERRPKGDLFLRIHHDENAEVYLNGQRVAELKGYTVNYRLVALPESAAEALRDGENVLAIHCRQTGGGQYIDAGLVEVVERERKRPE